MSPTERVTLALAASGLDCKIHYLEQSAHTAQQAANALGCDVSQIVKSLLFKTWESNSPVLALVSGDKRLDTDKLAAIIGTRLGKADADFVKQTTGFTIGGVAPIGSISILPVYMDEFLLRHYTVWAAAGHPKTVFEINPSDLAKASNAAIADLV